MGYTMPPKNKIKHPKHFRQEWITTFMFIIWFFFLSSISVIFINQSKKRKTNKIVEYITELQKDFSQKRR